ncbi:HAD-IIA family hydrolase [Rhodovibrionaceae bacterium A322]
MIELNAEQAVARYEAIRDRLPEATFGQASTRVADLSHLMDRFDVWLLDAFGVLNVGDSVLPHALERVSALQAAGKKVMVLTNSARDPASASLQKYRAFGYDFTAENVVSSRDALIAELPGYPGLRWGVMGKDGADLSDLQADADLLADDPAAFESAEGFLLLSSKDWTAERQALLVSALKSRPRPVLVGNPDLVAPREKGFSLEPGFFAHDLADATGLAPGFFGKPFDNVFQMALTRAGIGEDRSRVVMVGDTLHTDVLGGAAAGVSTALITGHGLLTGLDVDGHIAASGICPDFIVERT